jgi:hypothetical protein
LKLAANRAMNQGMVWRRGLGLLMSVLVCGCGDDSGGMAGSDSDSASSTGNPETTSSTDPSTSGMSNSSTSLETDTLQTSTSSASESSSSGVACEPSFDPLPGDALPRCEPETMDCWVSCPGLDPHECTSACAAADPTPAYEMPDGSTLDCGRCINKLFGICWHESCPAEVAETRCCTLTSGCDPECIGFGPCDDQDLECIRQACGPELQAQSACLMETGALQSCRIEMGGEATECFGQ